MLASHVDPTVTSVFAPRTKIEPDGTLEDYASLFGEIDQARDMVMRGAFADTLATCGIRRLQAVDLWKISIVTFLLLAGAHVCAVSRRSPRRGCHMHARAPSGRGRALINRA